MKKISIAYIDNAHNEWLRGLDFYKTEIEFLKKRLTEIAGKNTPADTLKIVEHYENQFILQRDNIERLYHDIHQNLTNVVNQLKKSSAGYIDGILLEQHQILEEQYKTEEIIINELRSSFSQFNAECAHYASEWMEAPACRIK